MRHPDDELEALVVLLGDPVRGNPTQHIMQAAFDTAGLPCRYLSVRVPIERLAQAIAGLRGFGVAGAHVTVPHKIAVCPLLDALTPVAEAIGAVNCVLVDGERLIGDNTDGAGFVTAVQRRRPLRGARLAIIGAGGAARAIGIAAARAGVGHIEVINRNLPAATELAERIVAHTRVPAVARALGEQYRPDKRLDVLVQATSVGLGDEHARLPVALDDLAATALVAEVVPNPPQTALLRDAAERGLATMDGQGMLVAQAELAYVRWTGRPADASVMRSAAAAFFADRPLR